MINICNANNKCKFDNICNMAKLSNTKIISCSNEKAIKLWNIETSTCLKNLEGTINMK
jgi:WD40 repeat protein